ncbi:hypothetical protein V8Z80_02525 [Orrella sp. JC864]|uniref:hypothetical protein n=1 Tax=Orrella sp. JC864 TaxID=3120298 RepID=UPI00300843FD
MLVLKDRSPTRLVCLFLRNIGSGRCRWEISIQKTGPARASGERTQWIVSERVYSLPSEALADGFQRFDEEIARQP